MSEEPKPEYFYTTNYPHRWGSGPIMNTGNPDKGFMPIESLEEAKELAERFKVGGWEDDRCVTTYGVSYRVNEQE